MTFEKIIAYVGHTFMLLLIFFSVYFYQERMLHTDNAYGVLTLINTESKFEILYFENKYFG